MDNEAYQVATPLFRAITTGDTAAVRRLLAEGEDPNECYGADEEPALLVAAVERREEIVQLLLEAGAYPDYGDMCGYTPLMAAVCADAINIVKLLIAAGADPHRHSGCSGANALQDAAIGGHADIVELLLSHGVTPDDSENAEGMTALMCAVQALDATSAQLLLTHGANPTARSSKGDTALDLINAKLTELWEPIKRAKAQKILALLQSATA